MPHTLKQGGVAILFVFLVGLSALLGCKFNDGPKDIVSTASVTLGQPGPDKKQAVVTLWLENITNRDDKTVTIAEYGVPSPESVTVLVKAYVGGYARQVKTAVRLTCFVPVDVTGAGTLQLRVSFSNSAGAQTVFVTVYVTPSGSASVSPDNISV